MKGKYLIAGILMMLLAGMVTAAEDVSEECVLLSGTLPFSSR